MSGGGKSMKEVPSGSRKVVQSLKEIVNFASEIEIYAMLKECNMDPNEAVHRLLSQDTFHEVKSKREKKKETKDTPESRSRSMNNNPTRAARGGTERGVRPNSSQTGSYDYGVTHGKPVPKKENGMNDDPSSLIAGSAAAGSNLNLKSTKLCEAASVQNTSQAMPLANGPSLPSQAPSGFQNNWSRMPGQMSMADIVRMGRPPVKAPSTHNVANGTFNTSRDPIMSNMSHQSAKQPPTTIASSDSDHEFNTSQDPISHGEERSRELGTGADYYNSYDDWSLAGQTSAGTGSTLPEISGASAYDDPSASSSLLADESNVEEHPGLDENQIQEEDVNGECPTESIRAASISDREDSGESAHPDDDPLNDMSPYHTQRHAFEQHGEDVDEEISSTTANLLQLNLQKGEPAAPSTDDNPAVIIPSHLQVTNADCSHLSFGSFGSGGSATLPGSFSSKPLRSNLEMAPLPEDTTVEQLNSRNPEYYDGDQLNSTLDENVTSRTSTSTISYDIPSASQPKIVTDETLAAAHGFQENFPSGSDYAFSATTQSTATYTYPDPSSQMQNLSHFSSLMQPYTNSLPSSLLASTAPPLREYDPPFSALLTTQSMPTKYNTATPSVSGPISMPEVKPEVFSSPQPTLQAMPSSNIPQHLQMHPYSQSTLPLGHFSNLFGYPYPPDPHPHPHPHPQPHPNTVHDPNQELPYLQPRYSFPSQPQTPFQHPPNNHHPQFYPPNYYNPYPNNPYPNYNPSDHLSHLKISDPASTTPSHYLTPRTSMSSSHQMVPFNGSPSQHGPGNILQIVPVPVPVPSIGSQHGGRVSLKVLLLHGSLDIWVCEARYLPNLDMFSKTTGDMFGMKFSGKGKLDQLSAMTSDPYVSIVVGDAVVGRTYVVSNNENPIWMQHFSVPVAHHAAEVKFLIKDSDIVGSQLIGSVTIPVEWIYGGYRIEGIYPVLGSNGKPCKLGATLRISMQYIPIHRLSMYHQGVGGGPEYIGVPGTYFPLRKGGRVTLYQDAHVADGCLPSLKLEGGMHYPHGKCWVDILEAISQARRLIYITGWSVVHTVRLVRDAGSGKDITLGELLKTKSEEAVRVLLLVWDDPTSRNILGYKMNGIMDTHDEETRRFFKNSTVQVLLCPRSAGKRHSWVKQQETGVIFTHHQKTVVVDADAGNNRRKIIAFVGGLDLCGGRYDTPKHPIFRTLRTLHKDDFHQPNFAGPVVNGPREPWHDLHTRIDGPAAYDVLTNFEERWLKAAKRHGIKKLKSSYDDALIKIDRIPEILGIHQSPYLNDTDPESWHVQIFRSIDSNSVKGFPKDPKLATAKNLACGKNVLIDMSIHTAYVKAIRSAQHFIYIENQYFLGSSYNWDSNKDLGANNLIPIEIALKIANKIKANERFSAYIVIPMWPEGNPTGAATQRILFWQKNTMQMMYETIYKALKEEGLEETYEPQDYLNFFCLGNREALDPDDPPNESPPAAANSPIGLAKKNRRFMIYVHSKGMIVDDEYLIVGSANINQRSLEGTRDTEIAMGAYQPEHTWARKLSSPRGQIYGYRMSLWAEHMGCLEECFTQPESLECIRRIRELGEMNWKQFAGDEIVDMKGHLLKYPVDVDRKGKVKPLPECETFPDLGGNICGSFLAIQENLTI